MRISLLRISLLRFFKTFQNFALCDFCVFLANANLGQMRFYGLFILLLRTQDKNFANAIFG